MHWFAVGISTSVLSLLMLSKGAGIETLGLITGIYSMVIVVLEFPSGVLSDLVGQKKVYLFALIFSIIGYAIVLLTNSALWLIVGFSFYGASRAFSSGSVEALFISEYMRKCGKERLHRFVSILDAGEIGGLAVGALTGGAMPMLWSKLFPTQNKYNGNLVLQIFILFALFLFTLFLVKEPAVKPEREKSPFKHIKKSLLIVLNSRNVALLIIGVLVWGFCFNAIELYWQPRVSSILGGDSQTWIFGLINSAYFLACLAGVGIINLILGKKNKKPNLALFLGRFLSGLLIVVMAFQKGLLPFTCVYLMIFMITGMMNIPQNALLNSLIPDEKRSTLLSFSSLMLQLGSILGALVYSLLIGKIEIPGVWMLAGIVFGLSGMIFLGIRKEDNRSHDISKVNNLQNE